MKKFFLPSILIIFLFFSAKIISAEQNDQIIITWQANNFYPSDYLGKALPALNTPIIVSAEIIKNGKVFDSSKTNFSWYADNELIGQGINLKEVSFITKKTDRDTYFIKVTTESNGTKNENSIRIPVSENKLVMLIPYPSHLVKAGSKTAIQALPYFFNISSLKELTFIWQINGQKYDAANDNQLILSLGTPKTPDQADIQISVLAQNKRNPQEFKESNEKLTLYE